MIVNKLTLTDIKKKVKRANVTSSYMKKQLNFD
jgi:hypothetical protein